MAPAQTGLLLEAVAELITTVVLAVLVHPRELVTVTVYTPPFEVVALLILGFCDVEVKPPGPAHT